MHDAIDSQVVCGYEEFDFTIQGYRYEGDRIRDEDLYNDDNQPIFSIVLSDLNNVSSNMVLKA